MTVRNRFNRQSPKPCDTGSESKVQQQFQDSQDINQVVKRFKKTGALATTHTNARVQSTGSFGAYNHMDFCEMYEHIQRVREDFQRLPARLRARFDNNPSNLVRFVGDERNLKECVKLGLITLPEGYELNKLGEIIEQMDIVKEAEKEAEKPPLKSDEEANPRK